MGRNDPASDGAKKFAYHAIVTGSDACGGARSAGAGDAEAFSAEADFRRLAFKALPIFETGGLWFSAHLDLTDAAFAKAWKIYGEAFPDYERRQYLDQMSIHGHPRYRFSAVMDGDRVVGMLAVWRLPSFWFIEHLAVDAEARSSGFGGRAVRLLQAHVKGPILLDVEPPVDAQTARRVTFYQRLGFHFQTDTVTLPPYAGKETAPSHFVSWPGAMNETARAEALQMIETEIYGGDEAVVRRASVAV